MISPPTRKIIHVDMDCFYAAIEIRDNPSLAALPVAVGGTSDQRGVLCTCNYVARKFGVRSAMSTAYAYRLCPELVVLPVNMQKYREAAVVIHGIFREFTDLVEPLSLDEAFLDVTAAAHWQGSATLIAKDIRRKIWDGLGLTASAGVAPNKFLAKIASGWQKPNGLFVIRPEEVAGFVKTLAVKELFGVGKVTAEKLHALNIKTCADLQVMPLAELTKLFEKLGTRLYEYSHGLDDRRVDAHRIRKSLSVEETFSKNISALPDCLEVVDFLYGTLLQRIQESAADRVIKSQYIKIKYSDFKLTTMERASSAAGLAQFKNLLLTVENPQQKSIRLLGLGVHFQTEKNIQPLVPEQIIFNSL